MKKASTQFLVAGSWGIKERLGMVAGFTMAGAAAQMFAHVGVGWALIFVAMLFTLVRGRRVEPDITGKAEWQSVTMDELTLAKSKLEQTAKTKRQGGAFSLKSCVGCGSCFLTVVVVAVVFVVTLGAFEGSKDLSLAPVSQGGSFSFIFVLDALTFMFPLWAVGSISLWEPPTFRMKMEQLEEIARTAQKDPSIQIQPSLLVAKAENGQVPLDCRLTAKIKDAPADFLGVQIQVTINSVQGTSYPYTYCVIIAKPEFRLKDKAKAVIKNPPPGGFPVGWIADDNAKKEAVFARWDDMVIEPHNEGGMDVVVVRQPTSGRGYTTSGAQAVKVFVDAMSLAQAVLRN